MTEESDMTSKNTSDNEIPASLPPDDIRRQAAEACQRAGFDIQWQVEPPGARPILRLGIPNGRFTRWVTVDNERSARIISAEMAPVAADLAPVTALGDYEAFLYRDVYDIEAEIRPIGQQLTSGYTFGLQRIPGSTSLAAEDSDEPTGTWSIPFTAEPDQLWSISIGSAADRFSIFTIRPFTRRATIKIANAEISGHDRALQFLERTAGAVLFELDLRYGLAFNLSKMSQIARLRRTGAGDLPRLRSRIRSEAVKEAPRVPRYSYPEEPLALYWYAQSAAGMPLLQYLACYQVLEYFFPVYYQREALDRIRQEVLDPHFSAHEDSDLARILAIGGPLRGRSYGDEREQLRATVRACVSASRLEEFLKEPDRADFFSGKQRIRNVGRIDLKDRNADLRDQVSNRIYDIRCRIVHTKADPSAEYPELLLPYSDEAESLSWDIELIQFLAQRVLINRGEPLRRLALTLAALSALRLSWRDGRRVKFASRIRRAAAGSPFHVRGGGPCSCCCLRRWHLRRGEAA